MMPGFHDAHAHLLGLAVRLMSVDCSPVNVRSIDQLIHRISERAKNVSSGEWIRAWGYSEFHLKEKRHPNRHDLDKACSEYPIALKHRSGHGCVLNTKALKLLGISDQTADPENGVIERDSDGFPTGITWEMNYVIDAKMPQFKQDEIALGGTLATKLLLSQGFTSGQDATFDNDMSRWQLWHGVKAQGLFPLRVAVMPGIDYLDQFIEAGLSPNPDEMNLRLGPVKLMPLMTSGSLQPSVEEFRAQVLKAHKYGFQVAIHAIESEVVRESVSAISHAISADFRSDPRHRIEHCAECPPSVLAELKKSGLIVVTNPIFLYRSGDRYSYEFDSEERRWLYRIGEIDKAGISVAFGTDTPVELPSAIEGIYSAVSRKALNGDLITPQESISAEEAIRMHTLGGAYSCFWDTKIGSIEAGKFADFILLDKDPTKVAIEDILKLKVESTFIGGQLVWEA
jgi:predicted amidohydrolase YtcJ